MAMGMPHQMGAISGTPLTAETGGLTGEVPATATASVWRTTPPFANLKVSVQKTTSGDVDTNNNRVSPTPSPPMTPLGTTMRADLSVACQALMESAAASPPDIEHPLLYVKEKGIKGVPVFVMMPLDSVKWDHGLNRKKAMNASLQALKSAGVEGIMMDVWWGLVERDEPGVYNWGGYVELLEMAKKHGLKVQAVMSFHKCGGNVGDSCTPVRVNDMYLLNLVRTEF